MSLVEYLYVDDARLDAYIEQIGSPVTYDKVPVWKAELGLTGPKAAASQERRARALTRHEKIVALLEHLEQGDLIDTKRVSGRAWRQLETNNFIYESCTASKVFIPRKSGAELGGVTLWVCPALLQPKDESKSPDLESFSYGEGPGLLCLLEDFRKSDETPFSGYQESTYTILESIILAIGEELNTLVVADLFSEGAIGRSGRYDAWDRAQPHMEKFVKDPLTMLENAGGRVTKPRRIRVLYRIREFGPEEGDEGLNEFASSTSVFGYPIFVSADS